MTNFFFFITLMLSSIATFMSVLYSVLRAKPDHDATLSDWLSKSIVVVPIVTGYGGIHDTPRTWHCV